MKFTTTLAFATISLHVAAAPNQLVPPAAYDNVGGGQTWGQVFTSEDSVVYGVRFYISDPSRPYLPSVNSLDGLADLVLFDASNFAAPIEVWRTTVQDVGGSSSGLSTFLFSAPVATSVGKQYFIAIDAADQFGIGIQDLFVSTYPNGFESRLSLGQIVGETTGRDLSFEVLTSPVPEPSALLLLASGVLGLLLKRKVSLPAKRNPNDA